MKVHWDLSVKHLVLILFPEDLACDVVDVQTDIGTRGKTETHSQLEKTKQNKKQNPTHDRMSYEPFCSCFNQTISNQ